MVAGEEENEEEESRAICRCGCVGQDRCGGGFARTGGWRSASSLFFLGKAGYVCLLSLLRGCFHVLEIGRVPSIHNIRSVFTMTTADSAVTLQHFFFFHPIYYPRTTLALPPSSNSDPGSHSGPSSSLPTSACAFISRGESSIFFPRRLASNCTYPRCLALSAVIPFFFAFLQIRSNKSHRGGCRSQGQPNVSSIRG